MIQWSVLSSRTVEVALRGNSEEVNKNSSELRSVRVAGRRWGICSSSNGEFHELERNAARLAGGEGIKLSDAELAVGDFKMGKGSIDEVLALEILRDLRDNFSGLFEGIITFEECKREIRTSDGADAVETRIATDMNVSIAGRRVASIHTGVLGGIEELERKYELVLDELSSRFKALERAKFLNPFMRGFKFKVILSKESSCSFIHEIAHRLEGDLPMELRDGSALTIYDEPAGFGGYNFDDEGVLARKRKLVEDGVVICHLNTRESAFKLCEEPGNARGLFTIPKAFQTNLVVEKGDWSIEEMISETSEGFLAEGILRAEIFGEMIRISPELCWYIRRGEIQTPVLVNEIRIPASDALKRVVAVGKEMFERIGFEKGFPISEKSPPILIEATVA
ncbi:hypothetical protein DRN63_05330 [Nanoarchaeota archaeon]|nr:MAG: hypothetical protein DRN63_05330 [Nanoarchaeota archaeon]